MPVPRGCSRATVSLPPARSGQRRLFAHCLNALKTFFGESPLADKGGICQGRAGFFPTSATVQAGVEVPGPRAGSWDQGGMQGKLGSKDALMGLSPGHPLHLLPPAQPCCHPSLATHTPPAPKLPQSPNLHLLPSTRVWPLLWFWCCYLGVALQSHGGAPRERQGLSPRGMGWPWGRRPSPSARGTVGLPWVSPLISCAAFPSAGRPQRL